MGAEADFEIAIARADAQEALRIVLPGLALLRKIFPEHPDRTAETERFELRPHIPVRPVMENIGQAVNVHLIPIDALFRGKASSVASGVRAGKPVITHAQPLILLLYRRRSTRSLSHQSARLFPTGRLFLRQS